MRLIKAGAAAAFVASGLIAGAIGMSASAIAEPPPYQPGPSEPPPAYAPPPPPQPVWSPNTPVVWFHDQGAGHWGMWVNGYFLQLAG